MKRSSLIIFLLLLLNEYGFSQTEQQLLPAERKQQTLITQPATLYKGFFRLGISAEYVIANSLFNENGEREALYNGILSRWNFETIAEYGITDRMQITALFPYTYSRGSVSLDFESPYDLTKKEIKREVSNIGFRDIQLQGAYQFILEKEKWPSMTLLLNVSIPTAKKNPKDTGDPEIAESPTGHGNVRLNTTVIARKINYPFLFSGFVSYQHHFTGRKSFDVGEPSITFKNAGILVISGQLGFHVNEWMAIINDFNYSTTVGNSMRDGEYIESSSAYHVNYSPTFTFQIRRLRINQFLTFPLFGKNTTADPRFELGIQYLF